MTDRVIFDEEMLESSTLDLLSTVFVIVELSTDEFWMTPLMIDESVIELFVIVVFSARLLLSYDSMIELAFTALLSTDEPSTRELCTLPLVRSE